MGFHHDASVLRLILRLWSFVDQRIVLDSSICWPNLVLDSGANKSGILLAISEVASLFERHILKTKTEQAIIAEHSEEGQMPQQKKCSNL